MKKFWNDHSLSITLLACAIVFVSIAYFFTEPGKLWDILSGIGIGFGIGALVNLLSGPLRERNRPDL